MDNEQKQMLKHVKKNVKNHNSQKQIKIQKLVFITITKNNIISTITDLKGNTLNWCSAGCIGFKGARRRTPFAAQNIIQKLKNNILEKHIGIIIKGFGATREAALKTILTFTTHIVFLKDETSLAHNGCRAPKKRKT